MAAYFFADTSFYSESEIAENGLVTAELDESGENKTTIEYISGTMSIVNSEIAPNGGKYNRKA